MCNEQNTISRDSQLKAQNEREGSMRAKERKETAASLTTETQKITSASSKANVKTGERSNRKPQTKVEPGNKGRTQGGQRGGYGTGSSSARE